MDLDLTITVLMIGTALLSARIAFKNRAKAWIAVQAINLVVLGGAWIFARGRVAWIAGPLWGVSILLPGIAASLAERFTRAERNGLAWFFARLAATLHPTEALKVRVLVSAVQRADRRGKAEEIENALERLAAHPAGVGLATLLRLRMNLRWTEIVAWLHENTNRADPTSLAFYVRALGEVGELETMCEVVSGLRAEPLLEEVHDQVLLFATAFAGREEATALVIERRLAEMPDDVRRYWLATAAHAAGKDVDAELRALAAVAYPRLARAALARIDARRPTLTEEAQRLIDEVVARVRRLEPRHAARPGVTLPIVLVNLYVFLREVPGGTTDTLNLYALGALPVGSLQLGEWYRVVTATFLHYGVLHVAMNMIGVLLFGPDLEAAVGRARAVTIYVASGILANVVAVLVAHYGGGRASLLVGASGSAMGVIGALLVRRVLAWRRRRTPFASAGIRSLLGIFALQIVFDLVTPRVAGAVHIYGAIAGGVLALVLGAPRWEHIPPGRRASSWRALAIGLVGIAVTLGALELAFARTSVRGRDTFAACQAGQARACIDVCSDPDEIWEKRCIGLGRKLTMAPDAGEDDQRRAFLIFGATCDAGSAFACTSMGVMVYNGQGTDKDLSAAERIWIEQCDAGEPAACKILQNHDSH